MHLCIYLLMFLPFFGIIIYKLLMFSHYEMYKKAHTLAKKELNLEKEKDYE